ncbi:MAG: hypothetical protein GX755_07215 [Syntrophomonadaceae bacterium]|nr:hypothetical protein [Syntrophomonadaceae bacterium]
MVAESRKKEIFKCGILSDLLIGNNPDIMDYVNEDGLTYREFIDLIAEMQEEGLIKGVEFIEMGQNSPPVCILEGVEVTDSGVKYVEKFMEEL